ncbi:MAG: EthD domain-containing protein [Actinomycetota bacterium]|nr:EthD domain-containing protein [Actinomycetota bacterium]
MSDPRVTAEPGVKMNYLIKRREGVSREELVAHWFANHMPLVIAGQQKQSDAGKPHAHRYIATLFDADQDGSHSWDGVAQLWWDRALPRPAEPHGTTPTDSFQQKAETYVPWPTTEYVAIDGTDRLPVEPLTLNPPFPCTRSGFLKVTFLVAANDDADPGALFEHWLDAHIPNVRSVMEQVGGFRYVVSHSTEPHLEPFVGMAELYFPGDAEWRGFLAKIKPDGLERFTDPKRTLVLKAQTEMIGIA